MKRYKHSLSHYHLTTGDMGQLLPVALMEVLPGDTFRHASSVLLRVSPLVKPVMHPVSVRIHSFFVPSRLIWSDWEDFITGKNAELTVPTHTINTGADDSDLMDRFGVPFVNGLEINELPIRVYNKVWNEYYRDQDLGAERAEDDLTLARCAWEKDYFTTCRANAQQGTEFSIPFNAGEVPVRGIGVTSSDLSGPSVSTWTDSEGNQHSSDSSYHASNENVVVGKQDAANLPDVHVDLSSVTGGIGIGDLRLALAQQRFAEAREFYGERYVDYLRWLGISPRDGRLDRAEYLGGGKQTISFSEVLATGTESGSTALGDMAGHGIATLRTRPYRRFFEEAGYVISVLSVRPRTLYNSAVHKQWFRSTKDDFWQKEFEILGPQAVTTKELYAGAADPTTVFGFTDRFEEYRNYPSFISGDFRDGGNSEDWHMAREFGSEPALNESFVTCSPTDRVYAATTVPELYMMINHHITARRLVRPRGLPRRL